MIIVETSVFTRQVTAILTDEQYRLLQVYLTSQPNAGSVIQGSGGLRKLRWTAVGRGKRGGTRIIYYWSPQRQTILMLLIYEKNDQEDLTVDQLKILRAIVEEEYR